MPTKKRRLGFIPRNDVFEIVHKLSFESNLSNSKIINILVEEALHKRGLFNIKTLKVKDNNLDNTMIRNKKKELNYDFKNSFLENEKLFDKQFPEQSLDMEIYDKFLLFLKFQEKMKASN